MGSGRPITDEDRRRVAELHAQDKTRNEIARAIGRAQSTVSKIAAELGLEFDRTRTAEATRAKVLDAKDRRAQLALDLLADAERLRAQMWKPCTAFNFGGKDNSYAEVKLKEPTFRDKHEIARATAVLVDKHVRLTEVDSDVQGLAAVDAWLRDITGTDDA